MEICHSNQRELPVVPGFNVAMTFQPWKCTFTLEANKLFYLLQCGHDFSAMEIGALRLGGHAKKRFNVAMTFQPWKFARPSRVSNQIIESLQCGHDFSAMEIAANLPLRMISIKMPFSRSSSIHSPNEIGIPSSKIRLMDIDIVSSASWSFVTT